MADDWGEEARKEQEYEREREREAEESKKEREELEKQAEKELEQERRREAINKIKEAKQKKQKEEEGEEKEEGKEKAKEKKKPGFLKRVFAGSAAAGRGAATAGRAAKGIAGAGLQIGQAPLPYFVLAIILMVVAIGDYALKNIVGYDMITTSYMSIAVFCLFLLFIWMFRLLDQGTVKTLFIFLVLDAFVAPMILRFLPTGGFFPWLPGLCILLRQFIWLFFAVVYSIRISRTFAKFAFITAVILMFIFGSGTISQLYADARFAHQDKYNEAFEAAEVLKEKASAEISRQYNVSTSAFRKYSSYTFCLFSRPVEECSEIINREKVSVATLEDPSLKAATKVEFIDSARFPKTLNQPFTQQPLPVDLKISSPNQEITITLSCKLTRSYKIYQSVIEQPEEIKSFKGTKTMTIACRATEPLPEGSYKVEFNALIEGLNTTTTLTRLFVGSMPLADVEKEIAMHSLAEDEPSKGSGFAAFSFALGTPITSPTIDASAKQPIIGNIENLGDGEIKNIEDISVTLADGMTTDNNCAGFNQDGNKLIFTDKENLKKIDFSTLKKKGTVLLLGCFVSMPEELKSIKLYAQKKTLESTIKYSYNIKKELSFSVKPSIVEQAQLT